MKWGWLQIERGKLPIEENLRKATFSRRDSPIKRADFSLISSGPFRLSSLVRERDWSRCHRQKPLIFGRNNNEAAGGLEEQL